MEGSIDYRACRCSTDTNNDTQCNTILLDNIGKNYGVYKQISVFGW